MRISEISRNIRYVCGMVVATDLQDLDASS